MPRHRWWLMLSFPLAALALVASLVGIFVPSTYERESANWAGQAVGQDIANLIAFLALAVLSVLTARGSLRAFLAWTGVVAYSVYTYAIYSFAIHFGPLFLVYVAVLGMSIFALVGGLTAVEAARVGAAFRTDAPTRSTAIVLIVIGSLFGLLWLGEITPAILSGTVPSSLAQADLISNPVYVLDLAVLLPASILVGALLLRRRPLGYLLAPTLLGTYVLLSIGIVCAFAVLAARGETVPVPVALVIAAIALGQLLALARFLQKVIATAELGSVERRA